MGFFTSQLARKESSLGTDYAMGNIERIGTVIVQLVEWANSLKVAARVAVT